MPGQPGGETADGGVRRGVQGELLLKAQGGQAVILEKAVVPHPVSGQLRRPHRQPGRAVLQGEGKREGGGDPEPLLVLKVPSADVVRRPDRLGPGAQVQLRPVQAGGQPLRQPQLNQPVPGGGLLCGQGLGLGHRAVGDPSPQPKDQGQAEQHSGKYPQQHRPAAETDGNRLDVIAPSGQGLALPGDADQQADLKGDEGRAPAVVQPLPLLHDAGAEEQAGFGEGDQLRPQGQGHGGQIGGQSPAQPVSGLSLPGGGKGQPHPAPQGEEQRRIDGVDQDGQGAVEGRGGQLLQQRGGPQHGKHNLPPQARPGQDPAQGEPPVFPAQGTKAQIQQDSAQQGQQIVQIEKLKQKRGQGQPEKHLVHGLPPGGAAVQGVRVGGELPHLLNQKPFQLLRSHSASPPNRFCSCFRMRYSLPSTARWLRPSSAAIWAVDCR